jgi:SpoVK/Ycf46/Vps4 family AAA+-type ATPase
MVAGVIARELGLELYKVDLSRVVDKYIGETEKNLGRIFDEAARSQAILLFDEADSLFSKRTAVKSSHDRYANLETNFLLQRIESFEGVCLLTSNFESSIDEAFKRRLRFKIAFPFPSKEERVLLWKAMIPVLAAASKDLNFHILAADFEMAGGHIKNAVLRAAFMAARAQQHINQDILYQAAMDEYREMGKLVKG